METRETHSSNLIHSQSKVMFWAGWVISALPILMMGVSGSLGLLKPDMMAKQFDGIGFPSRYSRQLAAIEVSCAIIYAVPQTAVIGAIFLTGYLGGAIACHVRVEQMTKWIPGFIAGMLVWLGLFLRDPRIRALIPIRR